MKLYCNVAINNRLSSTNVMLRKSQRSILILGKQTADSNELCLFLQTLHSEQTTTYKIDDNINKIFTRFINEGKATIRLTEPSHDLIIKSDRIQLKYFICSLQQSKTLKPSFITIFNSSSNKERRGSSIQSSVPKIKVVINKPSQYPVLEGFPRTTEELHLIGLNRTSFDRQVLKLQSLRILNLSNNQISSLPKELGSLRLQELNVSQNQLNEDKNWIWLDEVTINQTIKFLDISNNFLRMLPERIGKLCALVDLKASKNMLFYLPQSIGRLPHLQHLDVANNNLKCMPGSMRNQLLISLDISENKFDYFGLNSNSSTIDVPSLVECAARVFLKTRCPYDASQIPGVLVKYLNEAKYCICGNPCFKSYVRQFRWCRFHSITSNVKSSVDVVPFDCYFCSLICAYRNIH
ncbi:leucine-rich repeat protein 1 [Colletes gigas]|uniref:leucine-rich repeat protein 1 n=1 Tax=Colletes gigas TaxID=935657 RepID=UPI001C9B8016|nr:leucine-rich repeat protein 1 [Colletes gigas]